MKTVKRARRRRLPAWGLGAAGLLSFAGLLVLGPESSARADAVAQHDFIGAANCRTCHQQEYEIWAAGPHAKAMEVLEETQRRDRRCIQCHTMVPEDLSPGLTGIQCETCHGPGRYYSPAHVMRDKELRSRLLFEEPTEKTCRRCHTDSTPDIQPFSYEEALEGIRHWPAEGEGEGEAGKKAEGEAGEGG